MIIDIVVGCVRMVNNRLVVLLQSQHGCLVRRRNRYAIVVGDVDNPQYMVATGRAFAVKLTITELDNKIHDIVKCPSRYAKAMVVTVQWDSEDSEFDMRYLRAARSSRTGARAVPRPFE